VCVCYLLFVLLFSNHTNLNYVNVRGEFTYKCNLTR